MNIILLQDVPGLGFKDEKVKVKNGYGRNYIIPKGFGLIANKSNSKMLEENLKQPTIFTDQLPPMVFPFGYMIISSTFAYYDEDEDGNEE